MAPSKNNSHSSSNRNGEFIGRQANVIASAYVVDTSARLTGFHYSTTGAGGSYSLSPHYIIRLYEYVLTYSTPGAQWYP